MAADILQRVVAGTAQVLCYCVNESLTETLCPAAMIYDSTCCTDEQPGKDHEVTASLC